MGPQLDVALTRTNTALIAWSVPPVNDDALQQLSGFTTNLWLGVTNTPVAVSNRYQVVPPTSSGGALFRRRSQCGLTVWTVKRHARRAPGKVNPTGAAHGEGAQRV